MSWWERETDSNKDWHLAKFIQKSNSWQQRKCQGNVESNTCHSQTLFQYTWTMSAWRLSSGEELVAEHSCTNQGSTSRTSGQGHGSQHLTGLALKNSLLPVRAALTKTTITACTLLFGIWHRKSSIPHNKKPVWQYLLVFLSLTSAAKATGWDWKCYQ